MLLVEISEICFSGECGSRLSVEVGDGASYRKSFESVVVEVVEEIKALVVAGASWE